MRCTKPPGGLQPGKCPIAAAVDLPPRVAQFTVHIGLPGAPMLLKITEVGGVPTNIPVLFDTFDPDGFHSIFAVIPPGPTGITVDLQTVGFYQAGEIGLSNKLTLLLQ